MGHIEHVVYLSLIRFVCGIHPAFQDDRKTFFLVTFISAAFAMRDWDEGVPHLYLLKKNYL
jgi:hypothetical protein